MEISDEPFGKGLISTVEIESPLSPPRLLVNRTGGAGGLSSSLDILKLNLTPTKLYEN